MKVEFIYGNRLGFCTLNGGLQDKISKIYIGKKYIYTYVIIHKYYMNFMCLYLTLNMAGASTCEIYLNPVIFGTFLTFSHITSQALHIFFILPI